MQKSKLQVKNQNKSKREEMKCSQFFIKRFNHRYNLDYKVKLNNEDNSDIDVLAVSTKNPILAFQVVTGEGFLKQKLGELRTESKRTGKNFVIMEKAADMDIEKWIEEAIKGKANKKYSSEEDLILLVCREIGPLFNEEYVKRIFSKFKTYNFKGIYSVHLPNTPDTSSHPHNGQIIAIKSIFGNQGECF